MLSTKLTTLLTVAQLMYAQSSLAFNEHEQHVLSSIANEVAMTKDAGQQPVVIFDLDDTLFDSRYRKLAILHEFASEIATQQKFPQETSILLGLDVDRLHYDIVDTLAAAGVSNAALLEELQAFWSARFFTNEYVTLDQPIFGGVEYVNRLKADGAIIIYLTGRDAPNMGEGTEQALRAAGYPLDEMTRLMLKPSADIDDTVFKQQVFATIASLGKVVSAFDNEPSNVNAFKTFFKDATVVFLDTRHSKKPDRPAEGIVWIKDFKMYK